MSTSTEFTERKKRKNKGDGDSVNRPRERPIAPKGQRNPYKQAVKKNAGCGCQK
jgi:hypothetical protein